MSEILTAQVEKLPTLNRKPKTYVIGCAVLAIDIQHVAEKLGMDIGTRFLEGGLHDRPDVLRQRLQAAIDELSAAGQCDRIVIGYGICGRGTVGIRARDVSLAVPKVHDCIALFLGGDAAYRREFRKYPGTYYISAGWHEEKAVPFSQRKRWANFGKERLNYDELVEKYGEGSAKDTFRFLSTWQKNYQRAAFIDTGVRQSPKYEKYARDMAGEYGWIYERIAGDHGLMEKLLTARETTDEVLVVAPGHVIEMDVLGATLSANPIWLKKSGIGHEPRVTVLEDDRADSRGAMGARIGLGIDAGGTYTDAVIYRFDQNKTIYKSKALTTKWDFTLGIGEAIAGLDPQALRQVEMVAVSTTLATNAIVEGDGQKVGLIVMPENGLFDPKEIPHQPMVVVSGRLGISGEETSPVDEEEVRRAARLLVQRHEVKAFAVSGFAGAINPAHEVKVKQILRDETGLFVTCGHELSDILNFKVRAYTAALNSRIIPKLARLLLDLEKVLADFGIHAPIVVVKGDGTLMSAEMAKERPVETILSGPAASVAGARHLTGLKDALVVDMGGTTTDTAALTDGAATICETGSNVGGQMTHVRALRIRTVGLGGDSLIRWEKGAFSIGPRRVAPVSWLGAAYPGTDRALEYLCRNPNGHSTSSEGMDIFALTGSPDGLSLSSMEEKIVSLLKLRPFAVNELLKRTGTVSAMGLHFKRLEDNGIIQRCGLTPTDLLHVKGNFEQWSRKTAEAYCELFSLLTRMDVTDMADLLLDTVVEKLTVQLFKRELDEETDSSALDNCPVCKTLMKNLVSGGSSRYAVRIALKRPVIGIGAPIGFFLPRAAQALGAKAVLPEDADVANAIGAITSNVVIHRQVRIVPDQDGGFSIQGLSGARHFSKLEDADPFARDGLVRTVRELARAAGTSSGRVEITTEDQISTIADNTQIFLGRAIQAKLTGQPDLVMRET